MTAQNLNQALFAPDNFPGSNSTGHGFVVLIFAYSYAVIANLVNAMGNPFSILLLYSYVRGYLVIPAHLRRALAAYVTASLLALLCFIFIMHFLTQRYATLLCLLLLTLVPAALSNIYEHATANNLRKKFNIIFGSLCGYLLIDSLVSFGYSKQYIEDAGAWAATEVPDGANFRTNSFALAYASGRIADYDKVPLQAGDVLQQSASNDYVMLDIKRDDTAIKTSIEANPKLQLLQRFANERGDEVRVYLQH